MSKNIFTIHTDGGSRNNPGEAAIGVVIDLNEKTLHEFGKSIGIATNNVAEYTAVVQALTYMSTIEKTGDYEIHFILDSQLVVNQLNGIFKIKDTHLRELAFSVRRLEQEVGGRITYSSVPREQNKRADFFVNQSLDALAK